LLILLRSAVLRVHLAGSDHSFLHTPLHISHFCAHFFPTLRIHLIADANHLVSPSPPSLFSNPSPVSSTPSHTTVPSPLPQTAQHYAPTWSVENPDISGCDFYWQDVHDFWAFSGPVDRIMDLHWQDDYDFWWSSPSGPDIRLRLIETRHPLKAKSKHSQWNSGTELAVDQVIADSVNPEFSPPVPSDVEPLSPPVSPSLLFPWSCFSPNSPRFLPLTVFCTATEPRSQS